MTARRPHPKSKLGCAECRHRRIKCDEGRPDCKNCQKRYANCSFRNFDPIPRSAPLSTTKDSSPKVHVFLQKPERFPALLPARGLCEASVRDALLEPFSVTASPLLNDVLKHFAENTIPTFSSGVESQVAWQAVLPLLAGKYRFVTHGMLAVASLHLAYLAGTEHERSVYQDIAAAQMNKGTHGYRSEVQEVTTENAEALFAFSTTMTVFVLSTVTAECELELKGIRTDDNVPDQRAVSISSLVQLICRIFHSIRGALVILVPCWSHLCHGTLGPIVERPWWPVASPITPGELCDDQRLRHLETMWSRPGRAYDYSFDTLRFALRLLRDSFALVSRLESLAQPCEEAGGQPFDWTSALHWPTQITREFLALLEDECVEAWVLVAHFAILPAKIEGIIWLDGFATNTIKSAALVVGEENWDWLAWPAGAARVDLESVRGLSTIRQSNHTERPVSVSQLPSFSETYGALRAG